MRYYENLFIVNPGFEGDSLKSLVNEYTGFITENGGRVYNVDEWGKRRLAYRIQKQKYGTYVLLEFGAEGSLVRELEENQRLNDAVLNYLTVRLEAEPDLSEKRKRMEQEKEEYDEYDDDDHEEEDEEDEAEEAAEEQS